MRKHLFVTLLLACGMPLAGNFAAYANPVPQQQGQSVVTIKGTVLDENGEPAIGASVVEKGVSSNATATDVDGTFALRVKPGTILRISYVGYKTVEAPAQNGMSVTLQPTSEMLNELVAVGYGTQKRANLTGAVATVDVAKTMESRPVQDVTKALQGAVPGLTITTATGDIDQSSAISIRGVGTLTSGASTSPLIVVDGVPVDNMDFLNPEDIGDISVLKDAASSSIYGARAAFGVILVTTKSGSDKDRVSINYNNNFAWSGATVLPHFASTVDNIEASLQAYYRNPTSSAAKTEVGGMAYKDLLPYAKAWAEQHSGPYTDYRELQEFQSWDNVGDYVVNPDGTWLRYAEWDVADLLFNESAPSQKHTFSVDGTSGKTSYRISMGYDYKQGLQEFNPDKMSRYTANVNVSTELSSWLKAGARINYTQREVTKPRTSRNSYQYLWRWPYFMETYGWLTEESTGEPLTFRNEIMNRTQAYDDETTTRSTRLQGWLNANLFEGFNLQADFTYDLKTSNQHSAYALFRGWNGWGNAYTIYQAPTAGQSSTDAEKSASEGSRWTINVFATYAKTFAENHNLKLMAGGTAEEYRYSYFWFQNNGLTDYSLPVLGLTDGGKEGIQYAWDSSDSHRATAGFFGRVNYDYKGIYLAEANIRYDGSSRFPAADQWAWFPSFSAGYRFSEEAYFEPLKDVISNAKLRASYGHIGNESVGNYKFIQTISLGSQNVNWLGSAGNKLSSAGTPALVSSSLTWERIVTTDIGLDLGFMNNDLTVGIDWFQRETKDMIAPGMPAPSVLGAASPDRNSGNLRTRGWELSLSYNKQFGDVSFYAIASLSDSKSKVTKWEDNEAGTLYSYVPGKSGYLFYEGQNYGDIWGFEVDRYFEESDFSGKDAEGDYLYGAGVANQDYLEYGNFSFGPGDVKFKDLNGDGVINNGDPNMKDENGNLIPVGTVRNHGDLKVIGNALPRYEYSLRVGAAYKGFDLDLYFQGVGKRNIWQINSFVIPFAQTNCGLFDNQTSYNKYVVDANDNIVGYEIDQDNEYPALYGGVFGYNSRMKNTCDQGQNNFTCSDKNLVNMAYLRMKTITLGYTLPTEITRKALIQKARVYFSAENPFMIYNGAGKYNIDPEIEKGEASSAYSSAGVAAFGRTNPVMKTYSVGIQVTF